MTLQTTQSSPTAQSAQTNSHERGYKGVLLRQETKDRLRELRSNMADRNFYLERRLVTVAVEMLVDLIEKEPAVVAKLHAPVSDIIRREIESHSEESEDIVGFLEATETASSTA